MTARYLSSPRTRKTYTAIKHIGGVASPSVTHASRAGASTPSSRRKSVCRGWAGVSTTVKPIDQIATGDLVWAWDELSNSLVQRPVTRLFRHKGRPVLRVVCATDGEAEAAITCTPDHPFWVDGKGWVAAQQLAAGDRLKLLDAHADGTAQVVGVTHVEGTTDVYNFEVDRSHNYFVGARGVLVHNDSSIDPEAQARNAQWGAGSYNTGHGKAKSARPGFQAVKRKAELLTTMEHIFDVHGPGTDIKGKTQFLPGTTARDVKKLVADALANGRVQAISGASAFRIEHDFSRPIGVENGVEVHGLGVIVENGLIRTAFPIPSRLGLGPSMPRLLGMGPDHSARTVVRVDQAHALENDVIPDTVRPSHLASDAASLTVFSRTPGMRISPELARSAALPAIDRIVHLVEHSVFDPVNASAIEWNVRFLEGSAKEDYTVTAQRLHDPLFMGRLLGDRLVDGSNAAAASGLPHSLAALESGYIDPFFFLRSYQQHNVQSAGYGPQVLMLPKGNVDGGILSASDFFSHVMRGRVLVDAPPRPDDARIVKDHHMFPHFIQAGAAQNGAQLQYQIGRSYGAMGRDSWKYLMDNATFSSSFSNPIVVSRTLNQIPFAYPLEDALGGLGLR